MKKLIYLLALIIPLSAQEADVEKELDDVKEKVKETITETHRYPSRESWEGKRGMERRMRERRKEMAKKHKIRQAVRLVVVGGLAYYIGYNEGEKHSKGWDKSRYGWRDRK